MMGDESWDIDGEQHQEEWPDGYECAICDEVYPSFGGALVCCSELFEDDGGDGDDGNSELRTDGGRDIVDDIDFDALREQIDHWVRARGRQGSRYIHVPHPSSTTDRPAALCQNDVEPERRSAKDIETFPDSYLNERFCNSCARVYLNAEYTEETRNKFARGLGDVLKDAGFEFKPGGMGGNDPEVIL